jgi:tetratricopeptide (TPR) repeat protein
MHALKTHRLVRPLLGPLLAAGLLLGTLPGPVAAQTTPDAIRNYNMGIEAYNQGHTADALKKFTKATQIDPGYGDAYYNMGSIYYQEKQYDNAAAMFQKAATLSPNDSQAKYNLALALEKLRRIEEAVNVLSQIPASDPKSAQARAKIEELQPSLKPQSAGGSNVVKAKPTVAPAKPSPANPSKLVARAFSKGYDGPTGITIGPGGYMYVANYSKNLIYRVGAGGEKTVFAQGENIKGPIGLTYNAKTNELYVANYLLNSIARINSAGKVSTLVGGLTKPYNLFLDTINNVLYVSEQDPVNQISRVTLP